MFWALVAARAAVGMAGSRSVFLASVKSFSVSVNIPDPSPRYKASISPEVGYSQMLPVPLLIMVFLPISTTAVCQRDRWICLEPTLSAPTMEPMLSAPTMEHFG